MELTSKQRKHLEGLANDLEPVVRIGKSNITDSLIQSVRQGLEAHELIKVKILENAEIEREEAAEILAGKTRSQVIQIVGRIIILYRPNPEKKHRIAIPGIPWTSPPPEHSLETPSASKREGGPRPGRHGSASRSRAIGQGAAGRKRPLSKHRAGVHKGPGKGKPAVRRSSRAARRAR